MKIAVVIINWNNPLDTEKCVLSIASWTQLLPSIWVVDNASQDGKRQIYASQYPQVHYIYSGINKGFAGGNNLAIEQILNQPSYDAILLINNDAIITEENIARLIESFEAEAKLGIVGPILYENNSTQTLISMGGRDISRYIRTRNYIDESSTKPAPGKSLIFVDYVPGTVALIRSGLFRMAGFFDENYFFSGEMADLCERARQKGYLCAVNIQSTATHHFDPSSEIRQTLYLYYNLRNRFLYIKKFRRSKMFYLYSHWIFYGALLFLKAVVRFQKKRAKAIGSALIDGARGKFGNQNDKFLS